MVKIEKAKTTRRFGARYGRTVKLRLAKIEEEQRKKHKCPYCNKFAVKRLAAGIWFCKKCKAKFTGKAYSVSKKITFKEEISGLGYAERIQKNQKKEVIQNG